MTGDENKEVCMNTQHPSDSGNVELLKPSSVEETVGEDIKVENNKGGHEGVNNIMEGEDQMEVDDGIKVESNTEEQEGMDDKVEGKDHMEVDEGSNKDNTDEDVGEGKGTDDEEQNVKEVEDGKAGGEEVDGKIGDETSSGPLKDVSNDDIPVSVIRENSNTESHEKIHVTRSSTRVKNASHSEAKTVKASTLNEGDSKVDAPMPDQSLGNGVVVDEKVAVKAKGGLEEEGSTGQHAVSLDGQTGEEAFDGSLKDVSNDEVPASVVGENSNTELHEKVHVTRSSKRVKDAAHSEANTVKTSTLNEGDSQVDAPVPDQLLGNGVEVDEKVAFKAKGGLEEEGSAGQHAVSLDGQLGEEASGAPLKDILNDNIPVDEVRKNSNIVIQEKVHATRNSKRVKDAAHLEANSVKASNQNNGLSLVDAPVPDLPLGDGAEVNEKFPVEAKGGLEEEGPIGEHCVSLDGPNNVENAFVPCTNNGPAGPSTPILCKVNDEVNSMENVKEFPMSVDNTEQIQNMYSDFESLEGGESGTEEEQSSFIKELERVFKELSLEFKAPRFYGEPLNLLKLWRAVIKLGGYDKVTALKLWRQVGESFKPPKTCTTVSWTFRQFYEKALLDYERHKVRGGTLDVPTPPTVPMSTEGHAGSNQTPGSGSGRMRRDAAARAMQGWHSQRLLNNGEVSDPIIKDKSAVPLKNREKHLKTTGLPKRKRPLVGDTPKALHPPKMIKRQSDNTTIIDAGPPADWVKVNVKTTKDCYEVYALVPGLLREEVLVQTDPAGRLVITGEPENADNPWGVTPFKKVVTLPSRIDPHQTSAVVTLHGQLFVRVPFEQSD